MDRQLSRNMKNKSLVAFGSAAILLSVVQSAAATEKRDTRKVTPHPVSTSTGVSDARIRAAHHERRPVTTQAPDYPNAYYNGSIPMLAGH
jgi:hypothetical protein